MNEHILILKGYIEHLEYMKEHADEFFDREQADKDIEVFTAAIKALEQKPWEDAISRQAVEDKLLKLCNGLEGIFADIRMKEGDDCVCGLCEYDCDHGIDGSAFECPGFETDECFKLADEIRHEWQSTKDLPPVNPQPKTGHWVVEAGDRETGYGGCTMCSECSGEGNTEMNYCPNCGAKMIEWQKSEDMRDGA